MASHSEELLKSLCDKTIILLDGKILSNIVHSQQEHVLSGGVIPEVASKNHEILIYNH